MTLAEFVGTFDDFAKWASTTQIDYITYFLTKDDDHVTVKASDISGALVLLHLKPYKRLTQYLSENASKRSGKYVRLGAGLYRLELKRFNEIDKSIKGEPTKIAVSSALLNLIDKLPDEDEKAFLTEASNCYRIEAFRGFIIMVWIVVMDHLQKHIYLNELANFNAELAKNPDKKVKKIVKYDDFSDLHETKIIELARASGVISNDVRKILDEKLGTRNSAAHPSSVKITGHKATEFALDLIQNVLNKY